MTLEEAICSALEYEGQVRDTYDRAARQTSNPEAKRFFTLMTREEQGHVDYLQQQLDTWRREGKLSARVVDSVLAEENWSDRGREPLGEIQAGDEQTTILEHLYAALRLEEEVGKHYRQLVANAEQPEAASMFRRFLEIEDGHLALVQAEIDFRGATGEFYGVQEFTLDG